ncbi:MAG: cellulase family glycosylhydrolase [Bacteroidales bacterium]|nr:cellulase family glycosylhydrolase [Bacteroidales bacterium]
MNKKNAAIVLAVMAFMSSCVSEPGFVTRDGTQFIRNGEPYYFVGANYWVGPLLASPGESGDWNRLIHDLDVMQDAGIDNLRVLVGGDEACPVCQNVRPFLQRLDGSYDQDLLAGLDRFMAEIGRRGMTAVLYFNNSCDWSGGYVHYVKRVTGEDSPSFWDWEDYHDYCAPMFTNTEVQDCYLNHIKNIVSRVNTETGIAYKDDPAIFSWQLANEPRAFFVELHPQFVSLLHKAAQTIRSIDSNHMISTGMEGHQGTEGQFEEYLTVHADSLIDYLTYHIWPDNFRFSDLYAVSDSLINVHISDARELGKPLVIEEFGLIRDNGAIGPASAATERNEYYSWLLDKVAVSASEGDVLAGANFWAFAGAGRARTEEGVWALGDDFLGDPPFEPQGKFSVFDTDTATLDIVKSVNEKLSL